MASSKRKLISLAFVFVILACVVCVLVLRHNGSGSKAGALMTLEINGVTVNFRWAPAGTFYMGSPKKELEELCEEPFALEELWEKRHKVTLTQGFWIAETETTQELWEAVIANNPSHHTGNPQLPVESLSWYDCQDFVNKLNQSFSSELPSGYKFSLPTEAQWEYACRAGTTTPFNFGRSLNGDQANCGRGNPYGTQRHGQARLLSTTPVKFYAPNRWGLYDMHGNVNEWTSDWFDYDYSSSSFTTDDPTGPLSGYVRVLRGGGWNAAPVSCRSASRCSSWSSRRWTDVGFRLAIVPDSPHQVDRGDSCVVASTSKLDDGTEDAVEAGALKTLDIADVEVNFHWAPAGSFLMGSPVSEEERSSNESQHEVQLTQGFWIAETETTQQLWQAVMGDNSTSSEDEALPVSNLSWYDCQDFVNKLNRIYSNALPSGYIYAMPTEAQWEYACRAGATTAFHFGEILNGSQANCDGRAPYGTSSEGANLQRITPVKTYEPNAWGLYDMHGNLCEWTWDWYDESYYANFSAMKDPIGPQRGTQRVLHGGGWDTPATFCRAAGRFHWEPGYRGKSFGFRLVLVPESQAATYQLVDLATVSRDFDVDDQEDTREAGELQTLEIAKVAVNFHWAPAGSFSLDRDESSETEELPNKVELTRGFWIAETETTQELWQAVNGDNPSRFQGEELPVGNVSWYNCQDFIRKLNRDYRNVLPPGYKYALPTDAQWVYACRAGSSTPFDMSPYMNDDPEDDVANMRKASGSDGDLQWEPTPVKSYAANAWGLNDMYGNVFEWTSNWFERAASVNSSAKQDPVGPLSGSQRVLRFVDRFIFADSPGGIMEMQTPDSPNSKEDWYGFRLVLVPDSHPVLDYPDGDAPEATRAAGALKTLDLSGLSVNFHWAPAGTFLMGNPENGQNWPSEFPHEVTLTQGFWIAETETTQELWEMAMGNNPSYHTGNKELPVEQVCWNDCRDFVDTLNSSFSSSLPDGYRFALPTEAQWEYACRAGAPTVYNFGDRGYGDEFNFKEATTTPVKRYAPNAWGLYDMHGNVAEWTSDWFGYEYYRTSCATVDPTGPDTGTYRVLRGGPDKASYRVFFDGVRYYVDADSYRSARRVGDEPERSDSAYGFRLALVHDADISQEDGAGGDLD